MKAFKTLTIAASTAAVADAALGACGSGDASLAIKAAFQGMQNVSTSTTTECYKKIDSITEHYANVGNQFYWENFSYTDFLAPIYALIDASNATVDLFVYCDTTNLAKQFSTRLSSWSGLLDMATTIGTSFLKNYLN